MTRRCKKRNHSMPSFHWSADLDPLSWHGDVLVVCVAEEGDLEPHAQALDGALGGVIGRVRESGDFTGKSGEVLMLCAVRGIGADRVALLGRGKPGQGSAQEIADAFGDLARALVKQSCGRVAIVADPLPVGGLAAAVEGLLLGSYRFDHYRTVAKDLPKHSLDRIEFVVDIEHRDDWRGQIAAGEQIAAGVMLARDLINHPGNTVTPTRLAEEAGQIAEAYGLELTVLGREEMQAEGMGALLAVARGSEEEPKLIVLKYQGRDGGKPLVAVGKGLTFDAGGISLKPALDMHQMKYDMSGGAAVLGLMRVVGALKPGRSVIGIIPSSENLPDGKANKPGDILRSAAGLTIEVQNTDAEGRLILADALHYAKRFEPEAVVDLATLTGACVLALGSHYAAVLGTDQPLIDELRALGEEIGEPLWQLPFHEAYAEQLKSDVADLRNIGGREAGTITAALFLARFTEGMRWAHLDIAGTAWSNQDKGIKTKGGRGYGVRLLWRWVSEQG
ncbi:MAG: leucyl aminopeptidase [Alphaproteobacteria bacterium CG_4_10_14_0_2_um_filter_63_37]|nr:MAG: leucyl aminopeptidase [Alphaproteobacteria bacterium CG_4_10_14_0_2_um_filter_63_37]